MREPMHVFVVEGHPIFRRGLAECLRPLGPVTQVDEAADVAEATSHAAFETADLVFVDNDLPGAVELLRELADGGGADVIVLLAGVDDDVFDAVEAGAVGFLSKDTLTPETLAGAVQAAANGTTVIAPGLLAGLAHRHGAVGGGGLRTGAADGAGRRHDGGGSRWLTQREQQVLSLIAEGHPTREVAERLCYSERTVKNVLHDVVTKLGARSRSQAVAHAVRDGLI
jgi:DNA-binding NarL/FixJ family response regulator